MRAGDDLDFEMSVEKVPEGTLLTMKGVISERTNFELPDGLAGPVVVDGAGVKRINSLGVRSWIKLFERFKVAGLPVTVRRLSPVLVMQVSMINNFVGSAQIESIITPYICPNCDTSVEEAVPATAEVAESMTCPKCGQEMEFDAEIRAYLAFREV